jgi:hypothetical protein
MVIGSLAVHSGVPSGAKVRPAPFGPGLNGTAAKPVLEIESAEVQENTYNGETKKQIVLTFVGKDKVLGLNVTNARRLSQLISPDTDEWVGYRIKLFIDQTEMDGKTVDCIRIHPDLPEQVNQRARAATANDDSEPPF